MLHILQTISYYSIWKQCHRYTEECIRECSLRSIVSIFLILYYKIEFHKNVRQQGPVIDAIDLCQLLNVRLFSLVRLLITFDFVTFVWTTSFFKLLFVPYYILNSVYSCLGQKYYSMPYQASIFVLKINMPISHSPHP